MASAVLGRIDDSVSRSLRSLRHDIERDAGERLDPALSGLVEALGAKLEGLPVAGLRQSERAMLRNMALDVAYLRWPVPRLACLLPSHDGQLTEHDRGFDSWTDRLRAWCRDGKKKGKGKFRRRLRLFFLCASDFSLAECGPDGQGYEVREVLDWVKKARPVAKLGLALGSIVLNTCTGLRLPASDIVASLEETVGNAVSTIVEEVGPPGLDETASIAGEGLRAGGLVRQLRAGGERKVCSPALLTTFDIGCHSSLPDFEIDFGREKSCSFVRRVVS